MTTSYVKQSLFRRQFANLLAMAVLLLCGRLAMGQPSYNSPVGTWDCVVSGTEQGVAFLTFSGNGTVSGFEMLSWQPSTASTNPRGGSTDTGRTSPPGTSSTNYFYCGYAGVTGLWGYDEKGRSVGFFNESLTNFGISFVATVHPGKNPRLSLTAIDSPNPDLLDYIPRRDVYSGVAYALPTNNVQAVEGNDWWGSGACTSVLTNGMTGRECYTEFFGLANLASSLLRDTNLQGAYLNYSNVALVFDDYSNLAAAFQSYSNHATAFLNNRALRFTLLTSTNFAMALSGYPSLAKNFLNVSDLATAYTTYPTTAFAFLSYSNNANYFLGNRTAFLSYPNVSGAFLSYSNSFMSYSNMVVSFDDYFDFASEFLNDTSISDAYIASTNVVELLSGAGLPDAFALYTDLQSDYLECSNAAAILLDNPSYPLVLQTFTNFQTAFYTYLPYYPSFNSQATRNCFFINGAGPNYYSSGLAVLSKQSRLALTEDLFTAVPQTNGVTSYTNTDWRVMQGSISVNTKTDRAVANLGGSDEEGNRISVTARRYPGQ